MATPKGSSGTSRASGGPVKLGLQPGKLGLQPGKLGRQPGWFAHHPAMVLLSAPLRAFRALRPILNPALNLAQSILGRWSLPVTGRPAWRGTLQLERQAVGREISAQRVFHRLTERWNEKGERRSAFQPLSLPHGYVEPEINASFPPIEEEEELDLITLQSTSREVFYAEQAQEVFGDEASLSKPSSFSRLERKDPAPADRQVGHPSPLPSNILPVFARHGSIRPSRQEGERPDWPFSLVSLRLEPSLASSPLSKRSGQVQRSGSGQPATGQTGSKPVTLQRETAHPDLGARPNLQLQARMPVTTVRTPATGVVKEAGWEEALPEAAHRSSDQPETHLVRGERTFLTSSDREHMQGPESSAVAGAGGVRSTKRAGSAGTTQPDPGGMTDIQAGTGLLALARTERLDRPSAGVLAQVPTALEQEWPLFGVLRHLARLPASRESTAMQILRRMWPEADANPEVGMGQAVQPLVQASAVLGAGEGLRPGLRHAMEGYLNRDLSEVRLHTSPLAQTLRAEAFTSGRHIVFAPGRFEPGTPAGLALLGHELTHLGQPLAFKQEGGATAAEDSEEAAARTQEERIQQVFEKGWPEPPRQVLQYSRQGVASTSSLASPQYRSAASARASAPVTAATSGIRMVQRAVEIDEVEVETPREEPSAGSTQPGSQPGPGQTGSPAAGGQNQAVNVDVLARQVYAILKDRLRSERDRHHLYDL